MTETTHAQSVPAPAAAGEGGEAQPAAPEAPSGDLGVTGDEPQSFPADYVKQLRAEAAEHRVRAQRADDLAARLLVSVKQTAAGDVLRDTADLPEDRDYLDPDGLPDPDKIRAAAEQMVSEKPWLARARGGESFQGPRSQPDTVSLGSLLRESAR